jgi:peptide/nickel transport system substrate-binding protein
MTFKLTHEWCLLNVFVKRPSWVYFLEDFCMKSLKTTLLGIAISAIIGLPLFAGGGREQQAAGARITSITLAIGGEPDEGFDPCTGWGRYGSPLFQSTLLEFDRDMNIVNDLAAGYSVSANGLLWTFRIREDARFTDGQPVRASDVAFTFNTAKESGSEIDLTRMRAARAVNATSEARTGGPSVNRASSRMRNVHTSPSALTE